MAFSAIASIIGAKKNAKAIKQATIAQTAANDQAIALQREARDQNVGFQQPFYQTGLAANNRINALLGLNPDQAGEAQQGFADWRDNTGYNFRFNEGIRAIDAGAPVRNSGSTLKARTRFGQDIGSAEFYNHLGALGNQQQVGTGAANALSGVNTNYANNSGMLAQQQGQNLANSAVARANNSNALLSNVGSSFGRAAGAYFGYGGL